MGLFLQIALATTLIPVLVWRGLGMLTFFLMTLVLMAGIFGGIFFNSHLSAPVSGAISVLLIFGSFIVTKLLLERSSAPYRPQPNLLTSLQMGAGR